jgi:FkbM family methyltransferase
MIIRSLKRRLASYVYGRADLRRIFHQTIEITRNRAAANRWLPPYGTPEHHPVFSAFAPLSVAEAREDVDFLGLRTQPEMLPAFWLSGQGAGVLPAFDEEYFEWIDVMESVQAAVGTYTMIEFGAGYARWAARAWAAAHSRGLPARVGVVEAEPQHLAWARSHLAYNAVPADDIVFFDGAVGVASGSTTFAVGMPEGAAGNNPREWYGQAVMAGNGTPGAASGATYYGRKLLTLPGGWGCIEVPVLDIHDILDNFERVDLADFDVQGEETRLIEASVQTLTAKVKRLHIGTHSREIDAALPRILGPAGWRCLRAYPCLRWNRTEFGWISFNDGVQTWVNPSLD